MAHDAKVPYTEAAFAPEAAAATPEVAADSSTLPPLAAGSGQQHAMQLLPPANLVVVNPPWGRKLGGKADALDILRMQLAQWIEATFVVICPSIDGLLETDGRLTTCTRGGGDGGGSGR